MAARFLIHVGRATIHRILSEQLELSKVSARWVPRNLTDEHRQKRMGAALEMLTRYNQGGEEFLDRIVTGDETWFHYWTPETKARSMVWKKKDQPAPKKFKQQASAGKVMATVFWDRKGIIWIEYCPRGCTINGAEYFDTLMRLRKAIKSRRPGLLSKKVILLHDNAPAHSSKYTQGLLKSFEWDVFPHPPYSPDLAPSDYHLFPQIKSALGGKRFKDDASLQAEVAAICQKLDGAWYSLGIIKLISRYNKCLDNGGDYVEK